MGEWENRGKNFEINRRAIATANQNGYCQRIVFQSAMGQLIRRRTHQKVSLSDLCLLQLNLN